MKMSKCGVHGGQEREKIIKEDGIERMGFSLYQWTLREDELPLMTFVHAALHDEKGHFPWGVGWGWVESHGVLLVDQIDLSDLPLWA